MSNTFFSARVSVVALALALALGAAPSYAEGDPAAGEIKAAICMGCHGIPTAANVYPSYSVPKLGGQNQVYIVNALRSYRDGTRPHPTMRGNAANLSEADIADIAAFFSQSRPSDR